MAPRKSISKSKGEQRNQSSQETVNDEGKRTATPRSSREKVIATSTSNKGSRSRNSLPLPSPEVRLTRSSAKQENGKRSKRQSLQQPSKVVTLKDQSEESDQSDDLISIHSSHSEQSESDSDFETGRKGQSKKNGRFLRLNRGQVAKKSGKTGSITTTSTASQSKRATNRSLTSISKSKGGSNKHKSLLDNLDLSESSSEEDIPLKKKAAGPKYPRVYDKVKKLEDSSSEDEADLPLKISNPDTSLESARASHNGAMLVGQTTSTNTKSVAAVPRKKELSVEEMLAIGERMTGVPQQTSSAEDKNSVHDEDESSDISDSDEWEEVQGTQSSQIPSEGIIITVPDTGGLFQPGPKKYDIEDEIRLRRNRRTKQVQLNVHKTGVLCLLARGIMINRILCLEELLAFSLSLLPPRLTSRPRFINLPYVQKIITWYRYEYISKTNKSLTRSVESLTQIWSQIEGQVIDYHDILQSFPSFASLVFFFTMILRSLGIDSRLVYSLQPPTIRPSSHDLIKKKKVELTELTDVPANSAATATKTASEMTRKSLTSKRRDRSPTKSLKTSSKRTRTTEETQPHSSEGQGHNQNIFAEPVGRDFWTEVYLEEEERWISIDIVMGKLICDSELEATATKPIRYVMGFDSQGRVKDVTRRYASLWLNQTQKLRVDSEWWESAWRMQGQGGSVNAERDEEEDIFLDQMLISHSIPKKVGEFKGHPLYALKRHLLKFEAIYPPEPPTLGFIKGEPIYARENVKTLHTRELWSRQAKVVRLNETPYNVVKARPKFDKISKRMLPAEKPQELFGEWQVEDFIPPVAQDGKVPRNEYGNVELFKSSMLPTGTVHLLLPGLNRVARKLDIDCASALTGFEFTVMGSRPVFDGFVVCEEFKEILLDAWNQEQDELNRKKEEKRRHRIYANWRRLIRGVMIREMLNKRHSLSIGVKRKGTESDDPEASSSAKRQKK